NRKSVSEKMSNGGTFLGTARLADFALEEVRKVAISKLKEFGIDAVVAIGGDGTYRGALALHEMGIKTVAIPATIDNDIEGTDFTIGFDTALQTIVEAVDKLRDTSSSHGRCSIVEVMGRNCGDLAIWTGIATGAEYVICKEVGYNLKDVLANINKAALVKNHAIIIVAENMVNLNELAKQVGENTPFEARTTILGHVQRGGSPTPRDRVLASQMGSAAIHALMKDESGISVAFKNNKIITIPIKNAIKQDDTQVLDMCKLFKELW
ncbi:MAG: ATP-dependent 6-phosphofructokinase, partial [Bacilli bacterium]